MTFSHTFVLDFFTIPFLQFGYSSICGKKDCPEPALTGVPDTGAFLLVVTVLDFRVGLGGIRQNAGYKACPIWVASLAS